MRAPEWVDAKGVQRIQLPELAHRPEELELQELRLEEMVPRQWLSCAGVPGDDE